MKSIDAEKFYEQIAELEAEALAYVKKLDPKEDYERWLRWTVVLTERTAFKHDVAGAPTIDVVPIVRCKDCAHWCICHHSDNWFCADGTPINTASDYYDDKGNLLRVDKQPVKHGHWIKNGDRYCDCSMSHHEGNISGRDNYCWFCGAKMDEAMK